MQLICLDLEGVLVPEIWIEVSRRTGIEALARTTRDEPDYDKLMRYRLDLLRHHRLRLSDIQQVIATMTPLEGAPAFLDALRARNQVVILSDTFYEFAGPLMRQLGRPTLFCHELEVGADGFVAGYRLRMADPKRAAVRAFKGTGLPAWSRRAIRTTTPRCSERPTPGSSSARRRRSRRSSRSSPVTQSYAELEAAIAEAI